MIQIYTQYKLSDKVKTLVVLIDKNINILSFINAKVKSANYQLYNIRIIRKTIHYNTCTLLIQILVIYIYIYIYWTIILLTFF